MHSYACTHRRIHNANVTWHTDTGTGTGTGTDTGTDTGTGTGIDTTQIYN